MDPMRIVQFPDSKPAGHDGLRESGKVVDDVTWMIRSSHGNVRGHPSPRNKALTRPY